MRRKTPGGTVEAGYDGSPAFLSADLPPSKHMALPATPHTFALPFTQQRSSFSNNNTVTTTAGTSSLATLSNHFSNPTVRARPRSTSVQQLPSDINTNRAGSLLIQPVFSPAYQSSPGPTAYNSTSYDRRSLWPESALSHTFHTQQPQPRPHMETAATVDNILTLSNSVGTPAANSNDSASGKHSLVTQNVACDSAFISAAQPMFAPSGLDDDGGCSTTVHSRHGTHPLSASISQRSRSSSIQLYDVHAPASSNLGLVDVRQPCALDLLMHAVGLTPGSSSSSSPFARSDVPGHIKEASVRLAESAYAKLVLHLSRTKKSFASRPLPNFNACSRPAAARQEQLSQIRVKPTQTQQLDTSALLPTFGSLTPNNQRFASAQQQPVTPVSFLAGGEKPQTAAPQTHMRMVSSNLQVPTIPLSTHTPLVSLVQQAKDILTLLTAISEGSGWRWIEGMNLGACLHYALEHFEDALEWFHRISTLQPNHVEVLSNVAATLYCMGRREEAVRYWLQAIHAKPSYFDSSEQLIGFLSTEHRHREIVEVVRFVQSSLRLPSTDEIVPPDEDVNTHGIAPNIAGSELNDLETTEAVSTSSFSTCVDGGGSAKLAAYGDCTLLQDTTSELTQAGFGCCDYAVPGHETGRMLGLLHAGANSLYLMKETAAALKAYEDCVLIAVGRPFRSIRSLVIRIRAALSSETAQLSPRPHMSQPPSGPPLLSPDVAKLTAQRTFPHTNGQLPGLQFVVNHQHKKVALTATSNALLSIAKILQDGIANNGNLAQGSDGQSSAVGDILSLYYLSMSIQESPSTANNVGILLASIQQSVKLKPLSLQQLQQTQQLQQLQQLQLALTQQQHPLLRQNLQPGQLPLGVPAFPAQSVPSGIPPDSSLALAFIYYSYGLQLDPKHVHLYTNLGSLLKDAGQLDLAIKMYEQAVACDGKFDIALTNLANAVKDRGRTGEAIAYYRRAVAANPNFTEAVCGLSTALNSVCDWAGRGGVVLYGGRYDRWHVDEDGMLQDVRQHGRGSGLTLRVVEIVARQLEEASTWGQGVLNGTAVAMLASQLEEAVGDSVLRDESGASLDLKAELRKWAGKSWEGSRVFRLVERATRIVMHRFYRDRYILGKESSEEYTRPRPPASLLVPSAPTVLPFHTFTCPLSAKEVRLISQRNALRISCTALRSPWLSSAVYPPPPPPQPHLKIGYISSDFNNHPLAHLMQSVFGFHDPTKAKAFCYATTPSDKSVYREKIELESPVFRDVTGWPPDRLIQQIVEDGIHILVNLNGYTRGAKNEIFAARPAPIQMAFMGFAGTLGAEWCDYLLADATAIPPSTLRPYRGNVSLGDVFRDEVDAAADHWIYAENIIYSRDTFFCCDHKQSADDSERAVTWQEEKQRRWKMRKEMFPSLSDDTIILGNFNQLYKARTLRIQTQNVLFNYVLANKKID